MFDLQTRDVLGPLVSTIAAVLSGLFFWLNRQMSRRSADRSIYLDGHKFLIEICKQLIADPALWLLYDDHPLHMDNSVAASTPLFRAKLEAFAHLHLNMFEIILVEVPDPEEGDRQNPSNVWLQYFHDTLRRCSMVRRVLEQPESRKIWSGVMLDLYGEWKNSNAAN